MDVSKPLVHFGAVDYAVFSLMLVACVVIGVYHGYFSPSTGVKEYIFGGKRLSPFPVALSLIASMVSVLFIQGLPSEVYLYGIQMVFTALNFVIAAIFLHWIYLPVFHELDVISAYEYLELRFNKSSRFIASFAYIFGTITSMPIWIYASVIGLNQVTGATLQLTAPIITFICVFYTCIGGMRAVVWTDVLQTVIMFGAVIWIIIIGTISLGGFSNVWQRSLDSGRLEWPSLSTNMTERHNLIGLIFGGTFLALSYYFYQSLLQRFMSLPSLRSARVSLWTCTLGTILLNLLLGYAGLLIYANYSNCDPLTTKLIKVKDQIFSLFVTQTLGDCPGISGLFIAAILSAGLSTLSTALNSVAAVVMEDFVKPLLKTDLSDHKAQVIMKGIVIISGILALLFTFFVEKLGSILHLALSIQSINRAVIGGMFTAGMIIPFVNSKGMALGAISGLCVVSWIVFGTQAEVASGNIRYEEKPVSVEGCLYNFSYSNISNASFINIEKGMFVLPVYLISYLWYTVIGMIITIVVAIITSWATGFTDLNKLDAKLLTPCVRHLIPNSSQKNHETYQAVPLKEM